MAESKKKSAARGPEWTPGAEPTGEVSPFDDLRSREELDSLSALQLVDLITSKLPPRHSSLLDMVYLRERVASMEELNDQARETIEKLDAIIEKLRSPAYR